MKKIATYILSGCIILSALPFSVAAKEVDQNYQEAQLIQYISQQVAENPILDGKSVVIDGRYEVTHTITSEDLPSLLADSQSKIIRISDDYVVTDLFGNRKVVYTTHHSCTALYDGTQVKIMKQGYSIDCASGYNASVEYASFVSVWNVELATSEVKWYCTGPSYWDYIISTIYVYADGSYSSAG